MTSKSYDLGDTMTLNSTTMREVIETLEKDPIGKECLRNTKFIMVSSRIGYAGARALATSGEEARDPFCTAVHCGTAADTVFLLDFLLTKLFAKADATATATLGKQIISVVENATIRRLKELGMQ